MGQTLGDGRFVISGVLGSGSQGDTLEAVDKKRGCAVAIKRFMVRGARSWKDVELAEREARVLSGLSHPLLPRAIAHFEHDGALYLVMEKVAGRNLQQINRLTRAQVIDFLHDAAEVLAYLHSRSPAVIHRDIKPSNVIARPATDGQRQRYVLVDFGSVRNQLRPAGGSTVVGTFGYMAAEQFQGRACTGSDVYAVGATALRMLTGIEPEQLPHRGLAIDVDAALGPRSDPALRQLLRTVLEPNPDKRPAALAPLLAQLPRVPPPVAPPQPTPAPPPRTPPQHPPPGRGHHHRASRRTQRHRARRQRRQARHQQRVQHTSYRWPWPLRTIALLALSLAQLAVMLSVGVAIPLLLTLLSLVFGAHLRQLARFARQASHKAVAAMGHARRAVSTGSAPIVAAPARPRQRVAPPSAPPRQRVHGPNQHAPWSEEHRAQAEHEAEQAAREATHQPHDTRWRR